MLSDANVYVDGVTLSMRRLRGSALGERGGDVRFSRGGGDLRELGDVVVVVGLDLDLAGGSLRAIGGASFNCV